jgi:hypothetical protein
VPVGEEVLLLKTEGKIKCCPSRIVAHLWRQWQMCTEQSWYTKNVWRQGNENPGFFVRGDSRIPSRCSRDLLSPAALGELSDVSRLLPACSVQYSKLEKPFTIFNRLTSNDPYMGRTAPLTSKRCILYIYIYIYSTNIGTEYFKHVLYSPFFSLQNAVFSFC